MMLAVTIASEEHPITTVVRVADRIRALRIRAGKSKAQIAESAGLNEAWYDDLERDDSELFASLTLFQAMEVAALLGVRLRDIVTDAPAAAQPVALLDLPQHIRDHVERESLSIDELEAQVGWPLADFMESPLTVAAEVPLDFLRALGRALAIDWTDLVPDEEAQ